MRLVLAAPLGTIAVLAGLASLPGCVVRAGPPAIAGYATVYAQTVPDDIYAYPHVWYEGSYAYLVGGLWYYPTGRGWVVLRSEPPPLYRYRSAYGYPGSPAYGRTYRQAAPPAYSPGYPPPAERVR
jgi:hypothetical protein